MSDSYKQPVKVGKLTNKIVINHMMIFNTMPTITFFDGTGEVIIPSILWQAFDVDYMTVIMFDKRVDNIGWVQVTRSEKEL